MRDLPTRLSPDARRTLRAAGRTRRGTRLEASRVDLLGRLYEDTTLSYRTLAERTSLSIATVSRYARRRGWRRPVTGAPEEHYTPEGRRRLRRSALADAILRQAEELVFQTEMNPTSGGARLRRAVALVRAASSLDRSR